MRLFLNLLYKVLLNKLQKFKNMYEEIFRKKEVKGYFSFCRQRRREDGIGLRII